MNLKESKLYTVIFTFIISFAFIVILAFINSMTREKIAINSDLFMIKAVLNAMKIDYSTDQEAYKKFKDDAFLRKTVKKSKLNNNEYSIYRAFVNNENITSIINTGQGLWGEITMVTAFDENIDKIIGVDIISQNETPGLGGRIGEKWFKDQFTDEKIGNGIKMTLSDRKYGDTDHNNSSFDAITGATRTSERILFIINDSIKIMKN
ncbi:MAG: FMN-binding protein [Spirochaetes bacterium]|nr:FMN-binding protein [Spirochaetota bacterium]